jgi:cbb3-type cytochrome oxidase subunit 3
MIGIFRGVATLLLLIFFICLIAWTWSDRRKKVFDSMARMALDEDIAAKSKLKGNDHE